MMTQYEHIVVHQISGTGSYTKHVFGIVPQHSMIQPITHLSGSFYWCDPYRCIPLQPSSTYLQSNPITECKNKITTGYMSGKRKGYTITVTIYPPSSPQYELIPLLLAEKRVLVVTGQCGIILVSTPNALYMDEFLWEYFLTALYDTLDVKIVRKVNGTVWDHWLAIRTAFSQWIDSQLGHMSFSLDSMTTIFYEMICAKNTTYLGNKHEQTDITYHSSYLSLLRVYHDGIMIPHFMLPETKAIVSHPICIPVCSYKEITEIMEALTSVANGELTATEFIEFYYPSHMSYEIDLDGFLYYENEHTLPYIVQIPQCL
jgi:hypothetical protein